MTSFGPVSAVVPVYGGAATLRELHRRLNAVLSASCRDHEIVFVEDAGPDDAWRVIETLARDDGRVRGLRLAKNAGQHNALLCGLRAARFDLVVTLDDDLQHPPEEIPQLLEALGQVVDVVYGCPRVGVHSRPRNALSVAFKSAAARMLSAPQIADISAFRALRVELRDAFTEHVGPTTSFDALLARATSRFVAVTCNHDPRRHGYSGYDATRLLRHAMLVWRGFSPAARSHGVAGPARVSAGEPALYEVAERAGGLCAKRLDTQVEFRAIVPADASRMFRWMQDPVVSRNIGLTKQPTLDYTDRWINETQSARHRWARAIVVDGAHVGNIVLDALRPAGDEARFSIYLGHEDARGNGIGRLALTRALEEGFGSLGLRKIWLTVFSWNRGAIRLYQQAGFRSVAGPAPDAVADPSSEALVMSLDRGQFIGAASAAEVRVSA